VERNSEWEIRHGVRCIECGRQLDAEPIEVDDHRFCFDCAELIRACDEAIIDQSRIAKVKNNG